MAMRPLTCGARRALSAGRVAAPLRSGPARQLATSKIDLKFFDGPGVQEKYRPDSFCFGCGPANKHGLGIASHLVKPNVLVTKYIPKEHQQSYKGIVNNGVVGTLLDCHGNWTAAMALMHHREEDKPPKTITASYTVQLHRPVPYDRENAITVTSCIEEIQDDRVHVKTWMRVSESTLRPIMEASGEKGPVDTLVAQGEGWFSEIKKGCSPANMHFHWNSGS